MEYATTNPTYPEAHNNRYESKRICDCMWGMKHTVKVITIEKKVKP